MEKPEVNISSTHEAAFNAAGEAMAELGLDVSLSHWVAPASGGNFYVSIRNGHSGLKRVEAVSAIMPTPALALKDAAEKYAQEAGAPVKLRTAAEAIAAVKAIVGIDPEVLAKIDGLQVAP